MKYQYGPTKLRQEKKAHYNDIHSDLIKEELILREKSFLFVKCVYQLVNEKVCNILPFTTIAN